MARVYIPILMHLIAVVAVAGGMLGLSWWVGVKRPSKEKLGPYECGSIPVGDSRGTFSVSFYLIGMLFILFDTEVFFFAPIAIHLRAYGLYALGETITFVTLLVVALVYVWRRGALEWR